MSVASFGTGKSTSFSVVGCESSDHTNQEMHWRHIGDTAICLVCKGGVESNLHVFWDCPAMAGIWICIVPRRKRHSFFAQSLLKWVFENLGNKGGGSEGAWSTTFAVAVWWGWKWRCGNFW